MDNKKNKKNNQNKKYYKKNYYKKNNKKNKTSENKITYDKLMHADTITSNLKEDIDINKIMIIKYIAITAVLFAIIIGSIILFRSS